MVNYKVIHEANTVECSVNLNETTHNGNLYNFLDKLFKWRLLYFLFIISERSS